jgi:hypothetical protein
MVVFVDVVGEESMSISYVAASVGDVGMLLMVDVEGGI